jgi:hypothetical protein
MRKIQKHKEEMDESRKFIKTKRKEWKEFFIIFMYVEVPILVCFPLVENALELLPSCDLPSREPLVWGPPLQHKTFI